jgi:hypothetical protein
MKKSCGKRHRERVDKKERECNWSVSLTSVNPFSVIFPISRRFTLGSFLLIMDYDDTVTVLGFLSTDLQMPSHNLTISQCRVRSITLKDTYLDYYKSINLLSFTGFFLHFHTWKRNKWRVGSMLAVWSSHLIHWSQILSHTGSSSSSTFRLIPAFT